MEYLLLALIVFGIPFVLPIVAWVSARRTRVRIRNLETVVEAQREQIQELMMRLQALGSEGSKSAAAAPADAQARAPAAAPEAGREGPAVPEPEAERVEVKPAPPPIPAVPPAPPAAVPPAAPAPAAAPAPPAKPAPAPIAREAQPTGMPAGVTPPPPSSRRVELPPPPPRPPAPPAAPFDWEGLVGVKLFSAIAGIALVLAAVFFLRYSIEHGWLQPPIRVLIGVAVAVSLLLLCELKAARKYPATANALDAAAVAILFATFFAAHSLWNLIPGGVAFILLAVVTAVAVLLAIRRASLFIAVLGLLGGFATPALLSTGENRPIPLFAYLMLLNIGLARVAFRQRWPVLSWLTLILTTIYQWGWVLRFLHQSSLTLAMGVFIVFPLSATAGVLLARRRTKAGEVAPSFERTASLSAMVPLFFAAYLAAVPAYGANAVLLFGFLLLVDAGLLAIAVARREEIVHAAGALASMTVAAVWLSTSYRLAAAPRTAIAFTAALVCLYLAAPAIARRFGRAFQGPAHQARFAAPLLLFVFVVLARIEPAFAAPLPLMAPLFGLLLLIAWRAMAESDGGIYYLAAFFAVAAQASWAATHIALETLRTAVVMFVAFGLVAIAMPALARRVFRAFEPAWGSGAVLLASMALLMFLSAGPLAPAALWSFALLLAILNAGLFIESAAGGLPLVAQAGTLFSWFLLASWWLQAAGSIGVLPSLTVLVGLTLVTLGGHAWARTHAATRARGSGPTFREGPYLALGGHVFLTFLALNRAWSVPPWPLFGALAVVTLGTSAAALAADLPILHSAGVIAAAVVVAAWGSAAGSPPWGLVTILAAAVITLYAAPWIRLLQRRGGSRAAAIATAVVLFAGQASVMLTLEGGGAPPFPAVLVAYVTAAAALLMLTSVERWRHTALAAVAPMWPATAQWYSSPGPDSSWAQLLALCAGLTGVFVAYPLALGKRARGERDPYLAAVVANAIGFFGARNAFLAGGLDWAIGVVPVVQCGLLALLLRQLLKIQPAGERDMGRLALIAGASLAFLTVAIPLQLRHQWITIGWALEGAALAWLCRRIPHRGLLGVAIGLLGAVFVRLALNPAILHYEPRGSMRILNWYLYTYLVCAAALMVAGWWLSRSELRLLPGLPTPSQLLPAAGGILLFILLNIEIADYYATGPTIAFRFGVTVSQDLTYTIGWLVFGMLLLAAGIYIHSRHARVTAVALIAVTTFKCFLYDLRSLEGLYRVASFVGLALSLALVSLALQKYVLSRPRGTA